MRDAANSVSPLLRPWRVWPGGREKGSVRGGGRGGARGRRGGGEEEAWRLGDLERRRGVGGRNDNSVNEAEGKKMWHLCSLSPEKVEISH